MRTRMLSAVIAALVVVPAAAAAQTVDELVARNLAAKGGVERLKAVKAMRITGRVSIGPGREITMIIVSERPNKLRQESAIEGQKTVMAFDGQKAWMVNPLVGVTTPQDITGPQFDALKDQADLDGPFVDYKAKGITLELLGTEPVDGKPAYKIKVTRKSGQSQNLYLDASTGLEVKAVNEVTQGGMTMTVESLFSNYKAVDGLMLAHAITQKLTGPGSQTLEITIDKAEILPDAEDSLFTRP